MMSLLHQARAAREAQGMSQTELAHLTGTDQRTVSFLENAGHVPLLDSFIGHVLALGGQITVTFPEMGHSD
jgi:transcriptional regulator with XRE-family HTH domain